MSSNLKLADGTLLPLASAPQQTMAFADGQQRAGYTIQITATRTAESVNALVGDPAKTATWSIVNDDTVTGSYSDYTILTGGVTLDGDTLKFTLCKRTEIEVQQAAQAATQAAQAEAIAELSILVAGGAK